ncbi:unnamed protein product [Cercopithifilaria johnstoni]|uniref:Uncharacterized protein n=1 Tax=Cercopithifilaria johnstoni TaxID=2874296 RepID=A0A8J2M5Z6_9BILA|nr:unnamed protein product [Cercopithifilaria johnstoni]
MTGGVDGWDDGGRWMGEMIVGVGGMIAEDRWDDSGGWMGGMIVRMGKRDDSEDGYTLVGNTLVDDEASVKT